MSHRGLFGLATTGLPFAVRKRFTVHSRIPRENFGQSLSLLRSLPFISESMHCGEHWKDTHSPYTSQRSADFHSAVNGPSLKEMYLRHPNGEVLLASTLPIIQVMGPGATRSYYHGGLALPPPQPMTPDSAPILMSDAISMAVRLSREKPARGRSPGRLHQDATV